MTLDALRLKIESKHATVAIVGLGYVGLPVACSFARAGFHVIGLDVDEARVASIRDGELPIEGDEPDLRELLREVRADGRLTPTTCYERLDQADVVIISVNTPVDADHHPSYLALRSACQSLGLVMSRGTLVIVESTTSPGTIRDVVRQVLEESSRLQADKEFFVGVCPERVMPGKLLGNLRTMSRVCGGSTVETAEVMRALYRHVVEGELELADTVTAELVKTAENAYRDVQIAFANEVALVCEANGADVWRVRDLVNKSPGRHMLLPGAGVGGHCIPKDSWLLAAAAPQEAPLRLVPTARAVNESMPIHVTDLTREALEAAGKRIDESRVAVLGYTYLENSADTRNSPTADVVRRLCGMGAEVVIHDPWVPAYQGDLRERIAGADAAVVMVSHDEYRGILSKLKDTLRTPTLIDGRGIYSPREAARWGLRYVGLGRGSCRRGQ